MTYYKKISLNIENQGYYDFHCTYNENITQYECLECFNFKMGTDKKNFTHKDFLELLNLKEEDEPQAEINIDKNDQRNKFDFSGIKNSTLKEVIYFRMLSKELRKSMEEKTNSQYKQYPK